MTQKIILIVAAVVVIAVGFYLINVYEAKAPAESVAPLANGIGNLPVGPTPAAAHGRYLVSVPETIINWQGRKPLVSNYTDRGTLKVKEGEIVIGDDSVTGRVVFDMTSIAVAVTGRQSGESTLQRHLKSADFFDVEQFPTAELRIKGVENDTLRGDLTIKGVTNEVILPLTVQLANGTLRWEGAAELDRTKWNIRYGSGRFFDNLADNVIDDLFGVSFILFAHKE